MEISGIWKRTVSAEQRVRTFLYDFGYLQACANTTHTHYELFIISDGAAYHMINDSVQTVRKGDLFFIRPNDMHSYNFYHSENFCVRNLGFSTQVLRNVSLFLEQEEKMDKLINSEMPAYVHLEGENFRKVLDALDTAGKLVNSSHPRHARYHAQCVIALLLEDYFFTYDEKDPWNQMPSWLSELLLNMSKIENLPGRLQKNVRAGSLFSKPSLQASETDLWENSYSVYQPGASEICSLSSGTDRPGNPGYL